MTDPLETLIDNRVKDLLQLATDPKDLTAALKVAIEFWEKRRAPQDAGWGSALTGKAG